MSLSRSAMILRAFSVKCRTLSSLSRNSVAMSVLLSRLRMSLCASISPGAQTMSTQPAASALRGMESNCALSGACARARPPVALIAFSPTVPSAPMPESTTPTACSCCSLAIDSNSSSMGRRRPRGCSGAVRCSMPPVNVSARLGGIT